jgi:hypothetical protein
LILFSSQWDCSEFEEREMKHVDGAAATYWREFETRLGSLPSTEDDAIARNDLTASACSIAGEGASTVVGAAAYAELAHRLRYDLGSTIAPSTLDEVARLQMAEAADLLAAGVSPETLGLVGGGGALG